MSSEESAKQNTPPKNAGIFALLKDIRSSIKKEFSDTTVSGLFYKLKHVITELISNLRNLDNIAKNNYVLGKQHYELGNFSDAIMRFKIVTWLEPKHADAWYRLASSYMAMDKKPKAKEALTKAIQLKPNWQEAQDMLKSIGT